MGNSVAGLLARGLKPVAELAATRQHGDRLRYMAGCRCDLCRKANTAYESIRQRARRNGDWNGIVDAAKARTHLKALSRQQVGKRAVAAASDVALSVLMDVRSGRKIRIRARTERRILAVTKAMASDRALTSAKRTWQLIHELLDEGYTTPQLIAKLGYKSRALQFGRQRVTVRTAARVERLHRELTT